MKKNLVKILFSGIVAAGMVLPGATVMAKEVGDLTQFKLPAWQSVVSTDELKKSTTNAPWVINITALANAKTVDTCLVNLNGERRSDYTVVGVGRHEIKSTGTAKYPYKAVLMNSKSISKTGYLTGSWSPDNK